MPRREVTKVECEVVDGQMTNEWGMTVGAVCVRCPRCGHEVLAYGRTEASARRGLAMLAEQCPRRAQGEHNWYVRQAGPPSDPAADMNWEGCPHGE